MGAAIVQWRHLPGKIVLVRRHRWLYTCKETSIGKLPLTINFFLGTQLVQTTLTLL